MAMTNEQLTKWIDEIFGTIDEIKTNSGDITTLTKDVSDLKKQTAGTVSLPKAILQHFTDGSATQALDLVADITPVQAGTGDPSPTNVRAISGYSSVTAKSTSENLLPVNTFSGEGYPLGTNYASTSLQIALLAGKYTLSEKFNGAGATQLRVWKNNGGNYTEVVNQTFYADFSKTFEAAEDDIYIFSQYSNNAGNVFSDMQLVSGEEASTYEPYTANTATLSLGRTIYGGSADFTTGAETETLVSEDIGTSANITWEDAPALHAQGVFPFTISGADYATESWMAEKYKIIYGNDWTVENGQIKVTVTAVGSVGCRLCDTTYTSLEAMKTALTGSKLIHPITTPNTYTTTPAQLSLLQGENNVSATSGPITLTYAPDNVLAEVYAYIQKRFDTLTASLAANRTTRKTTKTLTKKED